MSRLKTIAWLLLIIVLIGIVAVATRTPAVTGEAGRAAPTPEPVASDSIPASPDPQVQSPSQ